MLPENKEAVRVFLLCTTQWRRAGENIAGLDYQAVIAVMNLIEVDDKTGTLDRLRVMEGAVLNELRSK